MKKVIALFVVMCILLNVSSVCFADGLWQDLGQGWRMRVDKPAPVSGDSKWHVHVNDGKRDVGIENVDGTSSHGSSLGNVPNKVREKVKANSEYKKAQKKQKDLDKAKSKIKAQKLKIDWKHVGDVIIAIGIVIACTLDVFTPVDDIAGWINFFRIIGAT